MVSIHAMRLCACLVRTTVLRTDSSCCSAGGHAETYVDGLEKHLLETADIDAP